MMQALLYIAGFVVFLLVLVFLRMRSQPGFEIKSYEIVLALLPLALYAFFTGEIERLQVGDIKIERQIRKAAQQDVGNEVVPVRKLEAAEKGGLASIPEIRLRRPEALTFRLGRQSYVGDAICQYIGEMPFLRYLVLLDDASGHGGDFWALVPIDGVLAEVSRNGGGCNADRLEHWIESSDRAALGKLPGTVTVDEALTSASTKLESLEKMNALQVNVLPVVADRRLAGVVERSSLVSGLIVEVARNLAE